MSNAQVMGIPEGLQVYPLQAPKTTNGGFTTPYYSLRNALKAWLVVNLKQAVGHATAITPVQASAVAGTGSKALSENQAIWYAEDTAVDARPAKQTSAKDFTVGVGAKEMLVVFEIDPAQLDIDNGFDCLGVTLADSSQATDFAAVNLIVQPRYGGTPANTPSPIVD